jgi:hypothetical protein
LFILEKSLFERGPKKMAMNKPRLEPRGVSGRWLKRRAPREALGEMSATLDVSTRVNHPPLRHFPVGMLLVGKQEKGLYMPWTVCHCGVFLLSDVHTGDVALC